jgi:hypothetical protein
VTHWVIVKEPEQMIGRSAVAIDRVDRRPPDLVVMLKPPVAKCEDADRFEAEDGRSAGFELVVDPRCELPRGGQVGSGAGPAALAVFEVAEVPDAAAEVPGDLTDAERFDF